MSSLSSVRFCPLPLFRFVRSRRFIVTLVVDVEEVIPILLNSLALRPASVVLSVLTFALPVSAARGTTGKRRPLSRFVTAAAAGNSNGSGGKNIVRTLLIKAFSVRATDVCKRKFAISSSYLTVFWALWALTKKDYHLHPPKPSLAREASAQSSTLKYNWGIFKVTVESSGGVYSGVGILRV